MSMVHYQSPWLYEIGKSSSYPTYTEHMQSDVVIIGGGISGVATAYFILEHTRKKVILLEGSSIASGASGHNAGQLVGYFERSFADIVEQYGKKLALEGQEAINHTWQTLAQIQQQAKLKTPIVMFQGLSGCSAYAPVYMHLQNRMLRPEVTHDEEFCLIAQDCPFLSKIPLTFRNLYTIVPRKMILDYLETKDTNYSVLFTSKKGCMNSARFCYEVLDYLTKEYGDRFLVYENSRVSNIELYQHSAMLEINTTHELQARHVVLCTNGFKDIRIINHSGETINALFHEALHGKVGFMKAYTFHDHKAPVAISYYPTSNDAYFYLTRRASTISHSAHHNLISIGGPEYYLADKTMYSKERVYPQHVLQTIDRFIEQTRINEFKKHYEHVFIWHGLMGYTKNGLRVIGPDKYNPVLMYNFGCNGVGILPAIYGGKKICAYIQNEVHGKSIFDPYF